MKNSNQKVKISPLYVNHLLNIEDIYSPSDQQTRVKVLILWSSGKTEVKTPSPEDKDNVLLIKNIALKYCS